MSTELRSYVPLSPPYGLTTLPVKSAQAFNITEPGVELTEQDIKVGVTITSMTLKVMPSLGATPTITKTITTTLSAGVGQITANGSTGQLAFYFILSAAEATSTVARVFTIVATDSLLRETTVDVGFLVPVAAGATAAPVIGIGITPEEADVDLGDTLQLVAIPYDIDGNVLTERVVLWSSSNTLIATVSSTGLVTPVAFGGVTIYAEVGGLTAVAEFNIVVPALARDAFNRADSATSLGYADTGQIWSALSGTWGISASTAYLVTDSGILNAAVVDSGEADVTVSVKWSTTAPSHRVIVRATDASNYFMVDHDVIRLVLYRRQAGANTLLATGGSVPEDGDIVSVTMTGSGFSVKQNEVEVITSTDSFNSTATKHGIGVQTTGVSRWDDFIVTG